MNALSTTLEGASDHQVWELLKLQDAAAWRLAWECAVLPEAESFRSGRKAREWGITPEEMMSMLYVEMIGARKIELYRDDGGSLWERARPGPGRHRAGHRERRKDLSRRVPPHQRHARERRSHRL